MQESHYRVASNFVFTCLLRYLDEKGVIDAQAFIKETQNIVDFMPQSDPAYRQVLESFLDGLHEVFPKNSPQSFSNS